jgi:hypothetical protein
VNAVVAYPFHAERHRAADPHPLDVEIIRMDLAGYAPRDIAHQLRLDLMTVLSTLLLKETLP